MKASVITIEITKQEYEYLRKLLKTGFYGKTVEEVAERVIAEEIKRFLKKGISKNKRGLVPSTKKHHTQ